ncbi:hypothetical protein MMC09_005667 [Bachmanniomyces sp. S44760]|nr:hypothetical protein [Bachmanniomyces sp. S44760]
MEPLVLKPRQPVIDAMECWDDDEDLQGIDDLQFRNVSSTTIATNTSGLPSHSRDSISSRLSTRSDMESNGEDDWQVMIQTDDESATSKAIASAKNAGIPIPTDVPSSALLGGTIKRLGGRKLKKVLGDDWSEDLEMPKLEDGGLKLKKTDRQASPEALRQISLAFAKTPTPAKAQVNMSFMERIQSAGKSKAAVPSLDQFREEKEDDDFFGDVPTIKIAKNPLPQKLTNVLPMTQPTSAPGKKRSKETVGDDFEDDIEFPTNGEPLQLSNRKQIPRTPATQLPDDFDTEWAEGSLGTRFGGTRREARSTRSPSMSALSPSVSSCLTGESEDEGLDGLVLPDGPLKFDEVLKKRLESASPDPADYSGENKAEKRAAAKEDFFSGIEIGDGDVFDSGKLTLNRNIKHKTPRQISPVRRTAMTLTFTNKPQASTTRIPRPQAPAGARSKLEPVSESGGPIEKSRRSQSRMGGHSTSSSASNIPAPSNLSFPNTVAPSTPSRRGLMNQPSRETIRIDSTTSSSQLLKSKRSMPLMKAQPSPARGPHSGQRPPSRSEHHSRGITARPKTPVDRPGAESSLGLGRKPPIPFLPAGTHQAQSHHISIKPTRNFHRPNSSDSNDAPPLNRPISRLSNPHHRPNTPTNRRDIAPESLAREAASKRNLTKPTRRRAFGNGNELEQFDDLPTSATIESKFVRQPVGYGAPKPSSLRTKLSLLSNASTTSLVRMDTPQTPSTPHSPFKQNQAVPRFAQDTNASRIAREQRTGSLNPLPNRSLQPEPNMPLAPLSTNWKAHVAAKSNGPPRHKRIPKASQQPCLIKPLGDGVNTAKSVKGMHWNPQLFRWEGNENALAPFDAPPPVPRSPKGVAGAAAAIKPALITNVGSTKGVQVVGAMVFDPQRMCWLKMGPTNNASHLRRTDSGSMSGDTYAEEEDDPFAGLDDLDEGKEKPRDGSVTGDKGRREGAKGRDSGAFGGGDDEWLVGEEFDVGPEFVRRQRVEEEKWRRKVEGWVGVGARNEAGDEWKWAIRGLVGR